MLLSEFGLSPDDVDTREKAASVLERLRNGDDGAQNELKQKLEKYNEVLEKLRNLGAIVTEGKKQQNSATEKPAE